MSDDLQMAKERLMAAAAGYRPLGFVQKRPWQSVGAAFAAGFLFSRAARSGGALAVAPLLLQAVILAEKALRWTR